MYGIDPNLDRSQWFDSIQAAARGEAVDEDGGGKITHVQDIADALTLALGDDQVAGEVFNLIETYIYWCEPPMLAAEISGSGASVADHRGPGPKNTYSTDKAVAFFNRHDNSTGLQRGREGVRQYVTDLLARAT